MARRLPLAALLAALAATGCSGKAKLVAHAHPPSSNPYVASLAYARCLRAHGVPHPNPDERGDFKLTAADERRLHRVPQKQRDAAMKACFHNLSALNMQPLSNRAHRRAIKVLLQLKRCMHGFGYEFGKPIVQNMSFGRAKFGFTDSGRPRPGSAKRYMRAERICERRVDMARKISHIIAEDRRVADPAAASEDSLLYSPSRCRSSSRRLFSASSSLIRRRRRCAARNGRETNQPATPASGSNTARIRRTLTYPRRSRRGERPDTSCPCR